MTDLMAGRLDRARKILQTITPGKDICYVGLFSWTVYAFLVSANSPIARGMPAYIHVPYVVVTLVGPLMVFCGQVVTCKNRRDPRLRTIGWSLQCGGDFAISCVMIIIGAAFLRTNDQYAVFLAAVFLGALWPVAVSIVVGDLLEIWYSILLRRRACEQAAADAIS